MVFLDHLQGASKNRWRREATSASRLAAPIFSFITTLQSPGGSTSTGLLANTGECSDAACNARVD